MYPWMAPERMNTVAADDGWELYDTTEDFSLLEQPRRSVGLIALRP